MQKLIGERCASAPDGTVTQWPLRYHCPVCGYDLRFPEATLRATAAAFAADRTFRLPGLPAALAEKFRAETEGFLAGATDTALHGAICPRCALQVAIGFRFTGDTCRLALLREKGYRNHA